MSWKISSDRVKVLVLVVGVVLSAAPSMAEVVSNMKSGPHEEEKSWA